MGTKEVRADDRRVQRTRRTLREALIALILERGWDGFSIQDLCERADVGRSTFYTHFADKEDVVGDGFAALRRGIRAELAAAGPGPRPLSFSLPLLEHARDHGRVFRALIGELSGMAVQRRFRDVLSELVREDVAALVPAGPMRDGTVAFLSGAFFDLVTWMLEARSPPSPAEVDALFQELAAPVIAAARSLRPRPRATR
jgi:AcrR family transcriptional regulator